MKKTVKIKNIKKGVERLTEEKCENDKRTLFLCCYLSREFVKCTFEEIAEIFNLTDKAHARSCYLRGKAIGEKEYTKTELKKIIKTTNSMSNTKNINMYFNSIKDFRKAFDLPIRKQPELIPQQEYELNFKLSNEENLEYLDACEDNDLKEVFDALVDEFYVWCGKVVSHGLQDKIQDGFIEVHESNMSKLDSEGKAIKRADGKILKSENYFKPELKKILKNG